MRAAIQAIPAPHGPTSKSTPTAATPKSPTTQYDHRPRQSDDARSSRRAPHPPRRGQAQQRLWPDWRHHAFITNTEHDTAAADEFHRGHAVVELAIRDLKEGTGLEHVPSGHYGANCATLACAVLAHNIGQWSAALAGAPPATNRSRRTRLVALAAVAVNRSGTPTLRYPARWPWETQFVSSHTQRSQGTARTLRLNGTARNCAPPHKPSVDNPRTTPAPLAEHAQTHQTTPPTTRRDLRQGCRARSEPATESQCPVRLSYPAVEALRWIQAQC